MEDTIKQALELHARGQIAKHKANVLIYLKNPVGIGEHPGVIDAVEEEIQVIAKYHDQLEVLSTYF
jgi:hypothetical protein